MFPAPLGLAQPSPLNDTMLYVLVVVFGAVLALVISFNIAAIIAYKRKRRAALDKIGVLMCLYDEKLKSMGIAVQQKDTSGQRPGDNLSHLRWMICTMGVMHDLEKLNRWLGFIQGQLEAYTIYTVDELREHVKNPPSLDEIYPQEIAL